MNVIDYVAFALLALSVLIVVVRLERGPSMLDRAVAMDVVTVGLIGGIALLTARLGSKDLVPVIAALALVGFISTVVIARFAAAESDEERRILTREELAALVEKEERLDDDAAPVHDVDGHRVREPDSPGPGAGLTGSEPSNSDDSEGKTDGR